MAAEIKGSVSLYGQRRPAVDLRDKSLSRPRTADAVAAAGAEEVAVRFFCRHQNTEKTRHASYTVNAKLPL